MKRWNLGEERRIGRRRSFALTALALALGMAGCSLHAKAPEPAGLPPDQSADNTPPPGPEAKIQISYSQPNDYLNTLSMTKYSGATVLQTVPAGSNGVASVVRFDGGEPTWQINIEPGMFTKMPIGSSPTTYAVSEVKYGDVPPHFTQTIPDAGPPEPLEEGHFYVFSVTRKSGSISYDAVKVNADGSLQAYEADPRAGSSFRLCCNLSSDFTVTAPAAEPAVPSSPSDTSGP